MSEAQQSKKFAYLSGIIAFIALLILDQVTKLAIVNNLKGREPIPIIKDVFELRYLENFGAAFGILQGQRYFFIVITIIIIIAVFYIYARMPLSKRYRKLRVILVMIAAGALGNFIDRTRQGYVVDFFYFKLIDFPIFNVADIYVTAAAIALVVFIIFYYKDEDIKKIGDNLLWKKPESKNLK